MRLIFRSVTGDSARVSVEEEGVVVVGGGEGVADETEVEEGEAAGEGEVELLDLGVSQGDVLLAGEPRPRRRYGGADRFLSSGWKRLRCSGVRLEVEGEPDILEVGFEAVVEEEGEGLAVMRGLGEGVRRVTTPPWEP